MLSFTSICLFLSYLSLVRGQNIDITLDPATIPSIWSFRSRPDLNPEKLTINTSMSGTAPGYIFMAPYQAYQMSATIYDMDGEVVWYGFGKTGSGNVQNFQVCQYNSTPHLCWVEGLQYLGYSRGQAYIMDTNMNLVKTVQSVEAASLDQHELNLINDSLIIDIYQPTRFDLSDYQISTGEGWVMNCIFQDIDLTSGEVVFEWSTLDHIALSESYVSINSTNVAGTGFNPAVPWDFSHLNSVDKDANGDYLVSCRHTDTLYKVNGQTGEIIWRCGGKLSDYQFLNGLNYSRQHDARWLSSNASTDVISLFDNGSDGYFFQSNHSQGLIIELNHANKTAELLRSYAAPADQFVSTSQGNVQFLNQDDYLNSNVFVNWGSEPAVTEYDPQGNMLYYAFIDATAVYNYRGFKFNITLTPNDLPALYTYALSTNDDTVYYMSWNGATEVKSYNIYGRSSCDSNFTLIGNVTRTGFETNYTAQGYQEYGMVEAVYANGTGIRNSTARGVQAFVPSQQLSQYCDSNACQPATQYVMAAANASSVAQTRSACADQAFETTSASASTSSSSSSKANAGSSVRPGMMVVALSGLLSTIVLVTVL